MKIFDTLTVATALALAAALPVRAQGPCDLVLKQGAQVIGSPAGKTERMSPAKNIEMCSVRSADSGAGVNLTVESGQPAAQKLMMAKMIAKMSKDIGQFREEAGLGTDAFSLRESDKIFFSFGAGSNAFSVRFTRDRGVTDADVERARQFAKQLLGVK